MVSWTPLWWKTSAECAAVTILLAWHEALYFAISRLQASLTNEAAYDWSKAVEWSHDVARSIVLTVLDIYPLKLHALRTNGVTVSCCIHKFQVGVTNMPVMFPCSCGCDCRLLPHGRCTTGCHKRCLSHFTIIGLCVARWVWPISTTISIAPATYPYLWHSNSLLHPAITPYCRSAVWSCYVHGVCI